MFDFAKSRAPRTTELYQSCYRDWEEYCSLMGARALPATAETVLEFLRAREPTHSNSALSARKSAIIAAHKDERSRLPKKKRQPYMLDHDDAFTLGWKEITRRKGNRHTRREPIQSDKLKLLLSQTPDNLAGVMDRAIMLTSLACALRRSETAAFNLDDIEVVDGAMLVHIRRSKTDQAGNGVTLAARATGSDSCPVAAMQRWVKEGKLDQAPPDDDGKIPLFAHPKFKLRKRIDPTYPYVIAKRYCKMAGLDPKGYGSHSFRVGFITEVVRSGKVTLDDSMKAARHKTPGVHLNYVADKAAVDNPAIAALSL